VSAGTLADAATLKANRRGIGFICLSMALFVVNDALVKYASETMPAAQLIFVRGVMASLLVLTIVHATGAAPRLGEVLHRWVALRALVDAVGTFLYLVALFHLPIANATAINMAAPLFIAVFAVFFLREQIGVGRWLAIVAGFGGVLLIIRPAADAFNVYAVVCLVGTVLMAVRDLLTRKIGAGVPAVVITFATAIAITLFAGAMSALQGWRTFGAFEFALLATASVFLAGGYLCLVLAMRFGELSVVGPFRYSGLLWALLIGFAVWGDVPDLLAWAGIALLIGSGLFLLHRERLRSRAAAG
jgi:drug/metabolite transporter (DMT)-like permease